MNNVYLVAGFRKGANKGGPYNLNSHMYANEKALRDMFAWVDGPDGNNMRKGTAKLTLNDIVNEINNKKVLWCENDDFFYVFKMNPKFEK